MTTLITNAEKFCIRKKRGECKSVSITNEPRLWTEFTLTRHNNETKEYI